MSVKEVFKSDWEGILNQDGVTVAKFGADWCGPCKMMAPVLDDLSDELTDVNFVEINIDDDLNEGLATQYHIRGIPTVLIINNGEVVDTLVGAKTRKDITLAVHKAID